MSEIVILLVIAFVLSKLSQMANSSKKQEEELKKAAPKPESPSLPSIKLNIPGVTDLRGVIPSWIKGYGISPNRVMAAGLVQGPHTLESLPEPIRGAATEVYENGSGMGLRLMELITGQGILGKNEYLWFVVVMQGTPQLHAFVSDKAG